MALDPNMRCPCGYRRFREKVTTTTAQVSVWAPVSGESGGGSGFGAAPYGTFMGSGGVVAGYGRFVVPQTSSTRAVFCESCKRHRHDIALGGVGALMAVAVESGIVLGASLPNSSLGCLVMRFIGDSTYETAVVAYDDEPPEMEPEGLPQEIQDSLPGGARTPVFLWAPYPETLESGTYEVVLWDRCADVTTPLLSVEI